MKTLRLLSALLVAGGALTHAQEPGAPAVEFNSITPRTAAELDQLLGPIALYPDALIALILPAATVPADVVLAVRYLQDANGLSQVENRAWDDSVKALTHYPEVLKWMDQNLTWTQQVGEAFRNQPDDVMTAVQRLRARAQTVGSLVDTPQQQVVAQAGVISIVPVQPDVIYVPYYDPQIVYVERPYYSASYFSFSAPYASGLWLSYGVDWNRRRVCYVERSDRSRFWNDYRTHWNRATPAARVNFGVNQTYFRPWTPRPSYGYAYRSGGNSYSRPPSAAPRATYPRSPEPRVNNNPSYNYAPQTRPSIPDTRPPSLETRPTYPGTRATAPRAPGASYTGRTFAAPAPQSPVPAVVPRLPMAGPVSSPATVTPLPPVGATRSYRGNGEQRSDNRGYGNRGSRSNPSNATAPAFSGVPAAPTTPPAVQRHGPGSGSSWNRPANPPAAATPASPATPPDSSVAAPESPRPNPSQWGRGRPGR